MVLDSRTLSNRSATTIDNQVASEIIQPQRGFYLQPLLMATIFHREHRQMQLRCCKRGESKDRSRFYTIGYGL
jgi:hypothetical protein